MTGDGVNDVLALKTAEIGVAMGSGAAATRAVAQLVLLDGRYTSLPLALAEGRRVIANIERVAILFLMKNVYAAVLALAVTVVGVSYPFVPLHVTMIDFLTIGVPSFFLSLAPSDERAHPGFVPRVLRRAVPAGAITGVTILAAYLWARAGGATDAVADTTAVLTLLMVGFTMVWLTARPMTAGRWALLASVVGAAGVVFAVPALRDFFGFALPATMSGYLPLLVVAPAVVVLDVLARREARHPDAAPRPH
jgi:cation-transporting ATPase E